MHKLADEPILTDAEQRPEVVDIVQTPIVFADWVVAIGQHAGVINIDLGSIDHSVKMSQDQLARVVMAARLRVPVDFASRLHEVLGHVIKHARGEGPEPEQGAINQTLN